MTAHPLLTAIVIVDLAGLGLTAVAAVSAVKVLLGWRPESADAGQVLLERQAEKAAIAARLGLLFILVACALFVLAVASVLPAIVKGAMCGTGVVNNMGGAGTRAIYVRVAAVSLLLIWHLVQRMGVASPLPILTLTAARLLVLALPVVGLSTWYLVGAFRAIDPHATSECCAAVLAAAAGSAKEVAAEIPFLTVGCAAGAAILGALAVFWAARPGAKAALSNVMGPLALIWSAWAWHTLLREFAPYHLGVLAHHCGWCLFLPEHHMVGIPLFLSLFVVAAEGWAVLIAANIGRRHPSLTGAAKRRIRHGAIRLLAAIVLFAVLTAVPALMWRCRHGVWITG
jgi:hypothetical protein